MTGVTQDECSERSGRSWRGIKIGISFIGLLMLVISWAVIDGRIASKAAAEVKTDLATHSAAQEEREENVDEKLDDIKDTVKGFDTKLDRVLRGRERRVGELE